MKKVLFIVVLALPLLVGVSMAADFDGDGTGDIAIFRASSGLWSVREITRTYFGGTGDSPVPGDYDGSGTDSVAIFRSANGLWAIQGVTRAYFGGASDEPKPGDYNGDGIEDFGIFRESSGLWAARSITRLYYGATGDESIAPVVTGGRCGGVILKTGQTISYADYDDGYYQTGTAFSYQTSDRAGNGDIVTTDNVTGLMWASDGSGAGCNFRNQTDWNNALTWAEGLSFAGYTDWRLPNRRELDSIVDLSKYSPVIDLNFFPNTKPGNYWSCTTYKGLTTYAWLVRFVAGQVATENKHDGYYVRAVRGGL